MTTNQRAKVVRKIKLVESMRADIVPEEILTVLIKSDYSWDRLGSISQLLISIHSPFSDFLVGKLFKWTYFSYHFGYNCQVRIEDILKLLVFAEMYLPRICRAFSNHRVSNTKVINRALTKDGKSFDEVVNLDELR